MFLAFNGKNGACRPRPRMCPTAPHNRATVSTNMHLFAETHTHQSTFDCALNERPRVRAFFLCEVVELHG